MNRMSVCRRRVPGIRSHFAIGILLVLVGISTLNAAAPSYSQRDDRRLVKEASERLRDRVLEIKNTKMVARPGWLENLRTGETVREVVVCTGDGFESPLGVFFQHNRTHIHLDHDPIPVDIPECASMSLTMPVYEKCRKKTKPLQKVCKAMSLDAILPRVPRGIDCELRELVATYIASGGNGSDAGLAHYCGMRRLQQETNLGCCPDGEGDCASRDAWGHPITAGLDYFEIFLFIDEVGHNLHFHFHNTPNVYGEIFHYIPRNNYGLSSTVPCGDTWAGNTAWNRMFINHAHPLDPDDDDDLNPVLAHMDITAEACSNADGTTDFAQAPNGWPGIHYHTPVNGRIVFFACYAAWSDNTNICPGGMVAGDYEYTCGSADYPVNLWLTTLRYNDEAEPDNWRNLCSCEGETPKPLCPAW